MIVGVLVPAAVLGAIVFVAVMLFQRGQAAIDLSPRGLLRFYVYIASLAGVVVFALGASSTLNYALARTAGADFVYGQPPSKFAQPPCPPGAPPECFNRPTPPPDLAQRQERERDRRRDEDLIRGLTFAAFGGLFWGAHWQARRGLGADERGSALRRGYLMLGTVVFGLATIVLLPTGIYQALSSLILPVSPEVFRSGAGEALSGGLVALPVWLVYLRLVVNDFRAVRAAAAP